MPRYVLASRRAGKFTDRSKRAARAAAEDALAGPVPADATVLARTPSPRDIDRCGALLETDERTAARLARRLPRDVLLEPEIPHHHSLVRPADFLRHAVEQTLPAADRGARRAVVVRVRGGGEAVRGARVTVYLRGDGVSTEVPAVTDGRGRATVEVARAFTVAAVLAEPPGGFWNRLVRGPGDDVTVDCPPLPRAGDRLGWWHRTVGLTRWSARRGAGIRVGVIDTGVGPHGELDHVVDVGAYLDADHHPDGGADPDGHGTHVCGILGGRPGAKSRFGGVAPGVRLASARVFPKDGGTANQLDIATAIDALSREHRADLLNLSLTALLPSAIEQDAVRDAWERGTVCVCAAGNTAGPVEYPAAFDETVAVSALGLAGWADPRSISGQRVPAFEEDHGRDNLYLADFSNSGPEITCTAPGVGVIAAAPEQHGLRNPQVAMDGTSMAAPVACGALAILLSDSGLYRDLDRSAARSAEALRLLRTSCVSAGLAPTSQGTGIPQATRVPV